VPLVWKPLGLIFNPTEHDLPLECIDFAQSPQGLVLPDRVRVFFSMRKRDSSTTFLSHVGFVDFSLDWTKVLGVNQGEVIPLGETGTFDEHGIFPLNVFEHGELVYGFSTGWSRRISVPTESSIGLSVSRNKGITFEKVGAGPILSASLNEPFLIADGCALHENGIFHMWYIFGERWKIGLVSGKPERVYKIAHATSTDLIDWKRNGVAIIPDVIGIDECQALPTVFKFQDEYHMIFCYRPYEGFREIGNDSYKLGYAKSDNLIDWRRDDTEGGVEFPAEDWDSDMRCYPNVIRIQDDFYLLYNGNKFGRYGFGLAKLQKS
jgi:hypothetical protein